MRSLLSCQSIGRWLSADFYRDTALTFLEVEAEEPGDGDVLEEDILHRFLRSDTAFRWSCSSSRGLDHNC